MATIYNLQYFNAALFHGTYSFLKFKMSHVVTHSLSVRRKLEYSWAVHLFAVRMSLAPASAEISRPTEHGPSDRASIAAPVLKFQAGLRAIFLSAF